MSKHIITTLASVIALGMVSSVLATGEVERGTDIKDAKPISTESIEPGNSIPQKGTVKLGARVMEVVTKMQQSKSLNDDDTKALSDMVKTVRPKNGAVALHGPNGTVGYVFGRPVMKAQAANFVVIQKSKNDLALGPEMPLTPVDRDALVKELAKLKSEKKLRAGMPVEWNLKGKKFSVIRVK